MTKRVFNWEPLCSGTDFCADARARIRPSKLL